jgi:arginase family enzyme
MSTCNHPLGGNEMPRYAGPATMFRRAIEEGLVGPHRTVQIGLRTTGYSAQDFDLVEVSPPCDMSGNTALLAANLLFEMLCSTPGCKRR